MKTRTEMCAASFVMLLMGGYLRRRGSEHAERLATRSSFGGRSRRHRSRQPARFGLVEWSALHRRGRHRRRWLVRAWHLRPRDLPRPDRIGDRGDPHRPPAPYPQGPAVAGRPGRHLRLRPERRLRQGRPRLRVDRRSQRNPRTGNCSPRPSPGSSARFSCCSVDGASRSATSPSSSPATIPTVRQRRPIPTASSPDRAPCTPSTPEATRSSGSIGAAGSRSFTSSTTSCCPTARQIDAVPTNMVFGPDGAVYVSTLTGVPFPEGAATVWRWDGVQA